MAEAKKFVIQVRDLHGEKDKNKVLQVVTASEGIDSVSVDMAANKMTVVGNVDSVVVVQRLRKKGWYAHIDTVGPAKEPEKKEEPKKVEAAAKAFLDHHHHPLPTYYYLGPASFDENSHPCGIL